MISAQNVTWHAAVIGRWVARIIGTLAFLFFLALVVGEGPPNPFQLSARENLSFLCMTILFLGLAFAWYREGAGGAITLMAFAALGFISGSHLRMPALQIPTAVGALHLICWSRLRLPRPEHAAGFAIPHGLIYCGCAILGLFLLLSANEIFGLPPLMTPGLHPGPNLAGTWSDAQTVFRVESDGQLTGAITGEIMNNRSWFGRLMHWRTDYLIRGTLNGRPYVTGCDLRGPLLSTSHHHYRHIQ